MNEIVNKFLFTGDKLTEIHLIGFTYSACVAFTKNEERIKKFKETGDSRDIYQNEFDKAWFQHDMAIEILIIRLEEQVLIRYCVIKHLILLKIQNMMDINIDLLQYFITFLTKKLLMKILKMKIFLIKNPQKNYTNQLIENLIKEKYTHLLKTLIGCRFSRYAINK